MDYKRLAMDYLKIIFSLILKKYFYVINKKVMSEISCGVNSMVLFHKIRPISDCSLRVGTNSMVFAQIAFEKSGAKVIIGSRSFIGNGAIMAAQLVIIGDDVMVAGGGTISDHGSHSTRFSERSNDVVSWLRGIKDWSCVNIAPIIVHDKAWIGLNSIILKGVTVGEGAIVGAGSIVTTDVPSWTIVAGNPAKVIRVIPEDER